MCYLRVIKMMPRLKLHVCDTSATNDATTNIGGNVVVLRESDLDFRGRCVPAKSLPCLDLSDQRSRPSAYP